MKQVDDKSVSFFESIQIAYRTIGAYCSRFFLLIYLIVIVVVLLAFFGIYHDFTMAFTQPTQTM